MHRQIRSTLCASIVLTLALSSTAWAETIAVMKLELRGGSADVAEQVANAIKNEIRQSSHTLSSKGSDVTLSDAQIFNDCDSTAPECLNLVADFLESTDMIYGTVEASEVKLSWYRKGQGFQRSLSGAVTNADDAAKLARRLLRGEQGTLLVNSGEELGAEVFIDGTGVGFTPYSGEFPIGSHTVQVKKAGFEDSQTRTIELRQGDTQTVDVELVAMEIEHGSPVMTTVGWVLTGVGLGTLAGATVTGVLMLSSETELEDKMTAVENAATDDEAATLLDEAADIASTGETLATTATILWGVGGTLTATGLVLVLIGYLGDGEASDSAASNIDLDFALSPNGGAAIFSVSF